MVWIGILLCLGITSAFHDDDYDNWGLSDDYDDYVTGDWGLSGFECNETWRAWNWRANNKKDCERYRTAGWCNENGTYGENWKSSWGNFDRWAARTNGPTALSCPQCGCHIVAKDAPDDKKTKYKIFEVAGKTYVRVESFGWKGWPKGFGSALNWYTARERCQRLGYKHGDLAVIPTYEEIVEVANTMRMEDSSCRYSWIGLKVGSATVRKSTDLKDWQWQWLTGETVNSTHKGWESGKPYQFYREEWEAKRLVQLPCGGVQEPTLNEPGKMFDATCDTTVNICSYLCQVSDTEDAADPPAAAAAAAAAAD